MGRPLGLQRRRRPRFPAGRKRDALDCYRSQFTPDGAESVSTRLTASTFRQLVESRDAQFGALAGVAFAEGLVMREPLQRSGLLKHVP